MGMYMEEWRAGTANSEILEDGNILVRSQGGRWSKGKRQSKQTWILLTIVENASDSCTSCGAVTRNKRPWDGNDR